MNLTKNQQLMLDVERVSGGSINVICGSVIIDKKLDIDTMSSAVNELFRINDALRIKLISQNGKVSQKIEDFEQKNIEVIKFSKKAEVHQYAQEQAHIPLDINNTLCEIKVIVSETFSGILYKLHHIISDAWTLSLLATQFNRIINGEKVTAYSYKDHIDVDNQYFLGNRYLKDKLFYVEQFKKQPEPVFLSEKAVVKNCAKRKSFSLDCQKVKLVEKFLEKNKISPAVLFLTIVSVYYNKITNNSESFYIGMPVVNRTGLVEKNTAGLFINTAPVLIELRNQSAFLENVAKIEETVMSTMRHQKYTYEDILTALNDNFGFTGKLFDLIFSYQNAQIFGDLFESTWYHNGMQRESLQIHIDDRDKLGVLKIHYDYQAEKFSDNDIDRLHGHICNLLFDAIENPDKNICDLEMLSSEEKNKLLYKFNDTAVDYPRDKSVHELFEEQAEKNPDKIAVVACDKTLTYKVLNEEANRIASALIAKGVKPKDFVAFDLKRKSYTFSVIFGILKAGATFVPVNNDYPDERKRYVVKDSNAEFVITEDNIKELLNCSDVYDLPLKIVPESLCYCIYTSGSTGDPKGTLISHKNVSNLSYNSKNNMRSSVIKENYSSICSFATVGFDMFIAESLLPLLNGMTVIFANEEQSISQKETALLFGDHTPDIFQCTPSKLKLLTADKTNCDYLSGVKSIIIGGESFDLALFDELKNISKAEIYNFYGPTEATVWVTNTEIKDKDIHIGKPMANTQIYIVDKYMKPVPIGVTGELCVAGDCVGAGYLNRPELTAEKFIDNPFGEGKIYKTGDLAYWREDGNIVYVGRNDFQVKIRGLRIELGEIENAISSVSGIVHSVVVVRQDKGERQLICAFYTGEEKSAQEIKSTLSDKLPQYMLPHVFTHLEEMPLTSSGKINRNALPEIDLESIRTNKEYIAPETVKEILLVECISDVLSTEKISVIDNFFDIGGDSLKAIELTARLEEKGYTVPIKTIFTCKDIRELAATLEDKKTEYIQIKYDSTIPVTAAQMRVYTSQFMKLDSAHYNIPFAFKTKDLDAEKLEIAVNHLIERHESLRTRFENREGQIVQIIEEEASIKVEKLANDDMSLFNTPFDLAKAPLIKVGYYKDTVMIVTHHIILDGESLSVLLRELNEYYMGRELPNAIQYGEFAVSYGYTDENEKYWLDIFSDEISVLELSTDFERPEKQTFNGSQMYEPINIDIHNRITEKCKELGITPYVFYMSCYNVLLSKYSGNEDIVVSTPISGRGSRYLNTIGMFVNTIALRSKPEGNKKIYQLFNEIRDNSIEAIANQNYPFGELVKKLNINISNRNPIFDVMLAYQGEQMTSVIFGDCEEEALPIPVAGVKCDLSFNIMPRSTDVMLMVEYCTDLYKEATVKEFISAYKNILTQALDETLLIKDIEVITNDEKQKLLRDFNNTDHKYDIPENSTIYSFFEDAAKSNLDKICIKTAEKGITFGELLSDSQKLDAEIRKITNGQKSIIAVIAERSVEMYTGIYGIIRGGNAYLPIDPSYPQERIDYIIKNSKAAAVVAQGKFAHLSGETYCIDMTEFISSSSNACSVIPTCIAKPDDTAYVIYTSGSTGNPKGAKVSHKSAINRILWMHDKYPLGNEGVIFQKTPYTFDVSVWELFWWGMCGGCMVASKPGEHFLPAKILDETYANKVTHLHFVPSVFELFLSYLETHKEELYKFDSVRYVFLSGEALTASLVQRFYKLYSYNKVTVHNLYGPTECAVDVTYYDCKPDEIDPIPIGKPIFNTQMYVVDKYMKPVPIGVTGELCIAGTNVGQGYLNNCELTSEKFLKNPFGEGNLYKTGDLAYWREDGQIIFRGRMDGQIKLNGQRIEIGEIETVINGIDEVDSAAVLIKKINTRDMIVAFYTGKKDCDALIKETCLSRLPKYMVPSTIVQLDMLPLNHSGKLDRKVLLQMEIETVQSAENNTPINDTERLICETFEIILSEKNIGRNSDFFEMGGTSLSMISLLSEQEFKDITAAEFMRNATPAKLALVMNNKKKIDLEYLEPLYIPKKANQSLILLPFAGGGPEAYSNFVNSLKKANENIAVYFIRYLHSVKECEKAANEIANTLGDTEILMYSHCVGSALALQILNFLEKRKVSVEHYFAGASIPPAKPSKKNLWNVVPDKVLKSILAKAGAQFGDLADKKLFELLKRFRKDTGFANISFAEVNDKVKVPVSVIISKKDIFTLNYKQTEKSWKNYAETINSVRFIDSESHYFQSDNSDELATVILSVITK